jgi:light-independent protochlorophyllide reductase subunit B
VHPLMMGLEEHLLTMFRGDFEFHDGAAASHLGHGTAPAAAVTAANAVAAVADPVVEPLAAPAAVPEAVSQHESAAAQQSVDKVIATATWAADAQKELQKIPFFVRGKARRNTERFAAERGLATITVDTLYDAKAHFGR